MRIQLDSPASGLTGTNAPGATSAAGRSATGTFGQGAGATGDSTSLSGISSLLGQLSADRAGRIAQLTSAVQNGTYNVPSAAISRAILNEAAG